MEDAELPNNIVFYDGVCSLCNSTVNFLIEHDTQKQLNFSHIDSEIYQKLVVRFPEIEGIDSILFYHNDQIIIKSRAVLEIARLLPRYSWLGRFDVVPTGIGDGIYSVIANNRYRWFGRNKACLLPSKSIGSRFLK